jgi:hypothetical protein
VDALQKFASGDSPYDGPMPAEQPKSLRTTLGQHKRLGKELIPPFMGMGFPVEQIFWWRDYLPEFLWIDSLVATLGEPFAVSAFGDLLSAADRFNPDPKNILDGTVSAFRLIRVEQRDIFKKELSNQLRYAVQSPFGDVSKLYPECPMSWLVDDDQFDREGAIESLREAVLRLWNGKDDHGGLCRALPLHRLFTHRKVLIVDTLTELIEAIPQYPRGDRYRVESFARQTHGIMLTNLRKEDPGWLDWTRSFWRTNRSLVPCSSHL